MLLLACVLCLADDVASVRISNVGNGWEITEITEMEVVALSSFTGKMEGCESVNPSQVVGGWGERHMSSATILGRKSSRIQENMFILS